MTYELALSPQAQSYLKRRAEAAGKDVADCVSELVEQAAGRSSFDELVAPLRAEFECSGTSDEELLEQINAARDEYRAGRP